MHSPHPSLNEQTSITSYPGKPPILRPKQRKEKFKTKQTTQGNEYPEKRYNQ